VFQPCLACFERGLDDLRTADEQPQCRPHGRQIGTDIDEVRDEQKPRRSIREPGGIVPLEVLCQTAPGHYADACAQPLHRRHEWIGEEQCPAKHIAELSADLAVGRDPARVIVGRDQGRAILEILSCDRLWKSFQ
jgi:hypothetical protein